MHTLFVTEDKILYIFIITTILSLDENFWQSNFLVFLILIFYY